MIVDHIFELAKERSSEKRRQLLRRLTDMFFDGEADRNVSERALFEEVVTRATKDLELKDRAAYAEHIADISEAPQKVILEFAQDEIEVARPILQRSPVLSDEDLKAIASDQSEDHLLAISTRKSLASLVTDVLIERGNRLVLQTLASNQGASISHRGFGALVDRAGDDDSLRYQLAQRTDLPENVGQLLSQQIARQLKHVGRPAKAPSTVLIDRQTAERMLGQLATVMEQREREVRSISDLVAEVREGKTSLDRELMILARSDRAFDVATVVQNLADSDHATVMKTITSGPLDPMIILFRSLGVDWYAFEEILRMRARRNRETYALNLEIKNTYSALSQDAANRVLRFLKVRRSVARATPTAVL